MAPLDLSGQEFNAPTLFGEHQALYDLLLVRYVEAAIDDRDPGAIIANHIENGLHKMGHVRALEGFGKSPVSWHHGRRQHPDSVGLGRAYGALRETGRGKHVGAFSYYHVSLIREIPAADLLFTSIWQDLIGDPLDYNVLKLDRRSRISFLMYQDFSAPFPLLDFAFSCDVHEGTARKTNYRHRSNPPILHRKELLLPADDPLVPAAVRLTAQLEAHGALANASSIGTQNGWMARLESIGLSIVGGEVQAET